MCQGSRVAKNTTDAIAGKRYLIGQIGIEDSQKKVGALYARGSSVDECVHCIRGTQRVTLSNIPADLQEIFGIPAIAEATFIESEKLETDDTLDFGNDVRTQFRQFADRGVELLVGIAQSAIPQKAAA